MMAFHPVCLFDMENAEHERYQHQSKCDLVSPVPFSEEFSENENEEESRDGDVCPMEHQHLIQEFCHKVTKTPREEAMLKDFISVPSSLGGLRNRALQYHASTF